MNRSLSQKHLARTLFKLLALLAVFGLIAASCGDDDTSANSDGDSTTVAEDDGTTGEEEAGTTGAEQGDTTGEGEGGTTGEEEGGAESSGQITGDCDATVEGSQIDYGVFFSSHAIDPTRASGALVGGTEVAAVYDVLFIFNPDTGEYTPHVAEGISSNDDFTEWTLKLREGVTYSDGTPLDGQMVADHLERFFDEGIRNTSAGFLTPITNTEVVDATTVVFTLDSPWVEFPFVFADEPGMIVNVNAVGDDVDAFGAMPPNEAGIGPYVVERNAPGEELVLVARDDYWGGPVCVERISFTFNPGTTYQALQAGDLNVGFLRSPAEIGQARDNGENEFMVAQNAGATLIMNHQEGRATANPLVREAIALAIDVNVINDRAYQGNLSIPFKGLVAPGTRFYPDAVVEQETDAARAAELLEEAKAAGYDGTLNVLCSTTPPAPDTALAIEGLLEAVGFDVTVETLGQGDQIGEIAQGNYDTACWGFNAGPATATTSFGRNLRTGSASNRMGYGDAAMDAALDAVLSAADQEAAFAEVNNIFVETNVAVNIGVTEEGIVWSDDVSGIIPTVATIFLFHAATVG